MKSGLICEGNLRRKEETPTKALIVTVTLLASILLFACGKQENSQTNAGRTQTEVEQQVSDAKVKRGKAVYDETGCAVCHSIGEVGGRTGPRLDEVGKKYDAEKLKEILLNPKVLNPQTVMPEFEGSEEDLEALIAYLLSLK
ncbi:MAG: c-type cytochrome [Candidatus Fervidibacter sp.]|uniref:c-type cytochrome n=1 Tax=Candidatus Fervidibacter sp. TaxID=3100871 RepID=UPI004049080D